MAKKGFWKTQVEGLCRLFGLKLKKQKVDGFGLFMSKGKLDMRYVLARGKALCQVKTTRGRNTFYSVIEHIIKKKEDEEQIMEKLMKFLSGKELLIRGSEEARKSPFGYTKIRTEQYIRLPEFGSVEELRLRLAAEG